MRIILLFYFLCYTTQLCGQPNFLDPTFGNNGIVLNNPAIQPGGGATIYTLMPLPDGKILAGGSYEGKACVIRYLPNGTIDNSFGQSGLYLGPNQSGINHIQLQPDGKIVAEGYAYPSNEVALTIRINNNGSADNSFGQSGIVYTNFAFQTTDEGLALALQPDGKIVFIGTYNASFITLARLMPNGSLDSTFGNNGILITNIPGKGRGISLLPDGRIVIGGTQVPQGRFIAMRFLPSGTLDTTYNHSGLAFTPVGDAYAFARAFCLQPDGKALVGGSGSFGNEGSNFAVARFMQDGSVDTAYGSMGIASIDKNPDDELLAMYLLPDGKLLAAGATAAASDYIFATSRIDSIGKTDSSFGGEGWIITPLLGNADYVRTLAIQPDGKVIAGGDAHDNIAMTHELAMVRYNIAANPVTNATVSAVPYLFPVPARNRLYITPSTEDIHDISALNIAGGRKRKLAIQSGGIIDINILPAGVYLFEINREHKATIYQKISIQ